MISPGFNGAAAFTHRHQNHSEKERDSLLPVYMKGAPAAQLARAQFCWADAEDANWFEAPAGG
jgi:hypothetical protein